MSASKNSNKLNYAKAGVDIEAGDEAVRRIKRLAAKTFSSSVLADIGTFGGMFKPDLTGFSDPVIVSSADGVGTKLKLAFMTGNHTTVGQDLVNHCIDDILVHGTRPLFFMDYIGTGKLDPGVIADLVEGLSAACQDAGVALLGGETAELPDFYAPGEYDLAGFIVGLVDRSRIVDGSAIRAGDVCIGLPSNGLHTNGYTLARKVAFEVAGLSIGDHVEALGTTIEAELMRVHRCYAGIIFKLLDSFEINGMAHITGGGLPGNVSRILPEGLDAVISKDAWTTPEIFQWIESAGNVDPDDMYRAFNMGIGFVVVVAEREAETVLAALQAVHEPAWRIGNITSGTGRVLLT